jgi:hypothetical protein
MRALFRPAGATLTPVEYFPGNRATILPVPLIGVSTPLQSFGISNPQQWSDQVSVFEAATRVRSNAVMFYQNFYTTALPSGIASIIAAGKVPLMTFQPYTTAPSTADLAGILAGNYDSVIQTYAVGMQGKGVIRFAHEMNTSAYPWGTAYGASNYVALWVYVRGVFRAAETAAGLAHCPWEWCPNIGNSSGSPFDSFYPGDSECEYVAIDGYSYTLVGYPTFSAVFDSDITGLEALTSKSILIGETGISVNYGDAHRATWLAGMFSYLEAHPIIKGFNWFDHPSTPDSFVIDSGSPLSCAAFRAGVAAWAPGVS